MDVIRASIPVFLGLIALELIVATLRRRAVYRLPDSISDLSCGVLSQLAGVLLALGTVAAFSWVSAHASIQHVLPVPQWIHRSPVSGGAVDWPALFAWVGVFLLDDFAYYWMHRVSHVVNLLWAGHVVHHSSEEFNLTVALRQSSLHGFMSWVFYLPLAFLGVPATMWFICHGLNLVYQFWVHTREINRLGPLEWVMNTPSHHRVHHGINPEYQDKNFAGTLIIWDRLFGTFEPEVAPPVYGITKPLHTWNPVIANVHVFGDIVRNFRASRGFSEKLHAIFGHPRWRPAASGPMAAPVQVSPESYHKFEPAVSGSLKAYALVHFALTLAGAITLLDAIPKLPAASALAGAFYVILSLGNIGGVLEARAWVFPAEMARLLTLGGAAAVLLSTGGTALVLIPVLAVLLASSIWMLRLRSQLISPDPRAIIAM